MDGNICGKTRFSPLLSFTRKASRCVQLSQRRASSVSSWLWVDACGNAHHHIFHQKAMMHDPLQEQECYLARVPRTRTVIRCCMSIRTSLSKNWLCSSFAEHCRTNVLAKPQLSVWVSCLHAATSSVCGHKGSKIPSLNTSKNLMCNRLIL